MLFCDIQLNYSVIYLFRGKLHLGHAWDTSLQDIIIRMKRMQGYDALWLPGMDHAGIATQAKVDKKLRTGH